MLNYLWKIDFIKTHLSGTHFSGFDLCVCVCVCLRPLWRTIPYVEELESIEQHPFLHIVINLLISPKAGGSIDLEGRRKEEKVILHKDYSSELLPFFLLLFFQIEVLWKFRSALRANEEKSDVDKEIKYEDNLGTF